MPHQFPLIDRLDYHEVVFFHCIIFLIIIIVTLSLWYYLIWSLVYLRI